MKFSLPISASASRRPGSATYPDVSVICGALRTDPQDRSTVLNPTVVVEVLSDSTAEYDRGEKLEHYRRIDSLREVVLVSHRDAKLELWQRDRDGAWSNQAFGAGERVALQSIGCELTVDELYDGLPAL